MLEQIQIDYSNPHDIVGKVFCKIAKVKNTLL